MDATELPVALTTTTTADGHYGFDNVKAGIRVRIVTSQGGRPLAQAFTLVTLLVETVDLEASPAASYRRWAPRSI